MKPPDPQPATPRLIAWELTRACVLSCRHCRACAPRTAPADELSTPECRKLLVNIAAFARPVLILTGGEPMLRPDLYEIAGYARDLGLTAVLATCGALLTEASANRLVDSGIRRISVSLDGATAATHDAFRGVAGAFDAARRGIEAARRAGIEFQVNTTVSAVNAAELPAILDLAVSLGAMTFNPFLLVPTGRGEAMTHQQLSAEEYERTLGWLADRQAEARIPLRVTCAPHYYRILHQRGQNDATLHAPRGCLGGKGFAFVSHRGRVQICGFLDIECGDLRREGLDFARIWRDSPVFAAVRHVDGYHGRCGRCEYRRMCGGCRARAYAMTGDYLAEEPLCTYQPPALSRLAAELDAEDKRLLNALQTRFPLDERPFQTLARDLAGTEEEWLHRARRLRARGVIRRVGGVFDSHRLGYVSTLVAARLPEERIDAVAARVSRLPGVTHNYRRAHRYNLWFTLTAPSPTALDEALGELRRETGVGAFHSLPALAVYKRQVVFDLAREGRPPARVEPAPGAPAELDEPDRALIRLLQEDLPLTPAPFAEIAEKMGRPAGWVLARIDAWLASGVLRRFGAVLAHQQAGFTANAMAVFGVPVDRIDAAGRRLAECEAVSHCYRRPALPDWPYNLFAMIHAGSADDVSELVRQFARDERIEQYEVLFSVTEYKKTSMRYFTETP